MTFGLRWDYWTPPVERYNRMVIFDQNKGELAFVLKDPLNFQQDYTTFSGDIPRGVFMNWKKTNFSPRISLAYLLTPKTTIRAAYGIYYTQGMANFQLFSSLGFGGPPFTNNVNIVNDPSKLGPTTLDTQVFPGAPNRPDYARNAVRYSGCVCAPILRPSGNLLGGAPVGRTLAPEPWIQLNSPGTTSDGALTT